MKVLLGKAGVSSSTDRAAASAEAVSRFLEEAQVTGQLDHPGVVPVHELDLDSTGQVCFTMRLVRGEDLSKIINKVTL